MSNHSRDYDKIVALLKSVAAPCNAEGEPGWRRCRHCLAMEEFERADVRRMLGAFLESVAAADEDYGKAQG